MKALLFDTGPIISITMNHILWMIEPLKKHFGGEFYITPAVKREIIDKPLTIKRFALEAIQVLDLVEENVLKVLDTRYVKEAQELLELANGCYQARGTNLHIVDLGEIEILTAAKALEVPVVIDERTVRLMLENPKALAKLLEERLNTAIVYNPNKVDQFQRRLADIKIIRSVEVVAAAFKLGLFDKFVPQIPQGKNFLLDALLWGVKTEGCSVLSDEISELKRLVK